MTLDLTAATRVALALKAAGTVVAAAILWWSVTTWYDANLYSQLSQQSPAVSVKVLSTGPVRAAAPGGEATTVRGAPSGLKEGSTISVVFDPQDPQTVFHSSADAGLKTAATGALALLAGGVVAWALLLVSWLRTPSRRTLRELAAGTQADAVIVETLARPRPRLRDKLFGHRVVDVVVENVDQSVDIVTVATWLRLPALGERVDATVFSTNDGRVAVRAGRAVWWPAPESTPAAS